MHAGDGHATLHGAEAVMLCSRSRACRLPAAFMMDNCAISIPPLARPRSAGRHGGGATVLLGQWLRHLRQRGEQTGFIICWRWLHPACPDRCPSTPHRLVHFYTTSTHPRPPTLPGCPCSPPQYQWRPCSQYWSLPWFVWALIVTFLALTGLAYSRKHIHSYRVSPS